MEITAGMMSSALDGWLTPPEIVAAVLGDVISSVPIQIWICEPPMIQ